MDCTHTRQVSDSDTHDKKGLGNNPDQGAPFHVVVVNPPRKFNSIYGKDRHQIVGRRLKKSCIVKAKKSRRKNDN